MSVTPLLYLDSPLQGNDERTGNNKENNSGRL